MSEAHALAGPEAVCTSVPSLAVSASLPGPAFEGSRSLKIHRIEITLPLLQGLWRFILETKY